MEQPNLRLKLAAALCKTVLKLDSPGQILPVPDIIVIGVFGGEEEAVVGRGWYALHGNFSSIFTRFRDIAAFVLQHATFPTPPLVFPKCCRVPLRVGGWSLGYKKRGAGLIVRAVSF